MPSLYVSGSKVNYVHRRPVPETLPAVVFVHGAGGSHQHWLYQVRDLPRAPTYALDLPGHGRSEGPGRDTITGYSDWILEFLDAAGLDQVVLVGHSMGGAISQKVALSHPQRVAGLALVGTGARLRVAPAILEAIQEDKDAAVRLMIDWSFGPEAPDELKRLARRQMAATPADILHGDLTACDAFDMLDCLDRIQSPAVIICGTQDRLTPAKFSVYLRDQIPEATLHLIEGAGHMVMVERTQAVVKALSAFLEGSRISGAGSKRL